MNDRFCTRLSYTETDHKVWMASGTFSSYLVYLPASAAREVFHRRANVTEYVSFSNTNGLPIKILLPYIFWYFYILSSSQLQSLSVFRYALIPFDFCKEMIKLEQQIHLKIPHYFVTWLLVETMQRQAHFFSGMVLSFWT